MEGGGAKFVIFRGFFCCGGGGVFKLEGHSTIMFWMTNCVLEGIYWEEIKKVWFKLMMMSYE